MITFTPKEIANIEQLIRRTTNKEMKEELGKTVEKIKTFNRKHATFVENNIELYMQTEGYAIRQMPQYKISWEVMDVIREAVRNSKVVTGIYHDKKRTIEPLGLICGSKIYLVAREKNIERRIQTILKRSFE